MKKILFLIAMISMSYLSGCYYDAEDELYPEITCDTSAVTYSGIVLPIIERSCYNCHNQAGNQGGITLEGYSRLKALVDNGLLLGVINHQPGFSPMPKNAPQLADCDIKQIEVWVNQGAPDN